MKNSFIQEVRDKLQQPDIKPLEDNLHFLRKNVYRALPTNRWETSRDAFAYKQVKLHLESFRVSLIYMCLGIMHFCFDFLCIGRSELHQTTN